MNKMLIVWFVIKKEPRMFFKWTLCYIIGDIALDSFERVRGYETLRQIHEPVKGLQKIIFNNDGYIFSFLQLKSPSV